MVPYPQWTRLEKRASEASSLGSTPSTLEAARAGVVLAPRPLSFISMVLDAVIAAVPATPANNPFPTAAATSPSFICSSPLGILQRFLRFFPHPTFDLLRSPRRGVQHAHVGPAGFGHALTVATEPGLNDREHRCSSATALFMLSSSTDENAPVRFLLPTGAAASAPRAR